MAKLTTQFNDFLKDVVNLNKTRVDIASKGIETMTTFLENDEIFGEQFVKTSPQGSLLQETIIKPVNEDDEFDVDLLFEMEAVDGWSAADYLTKLADQFKKTDRYKNLVDTKGQNRCVTIDYENDFHIDIVPTILTIDGYVIMNRKTDEFENTDGEGYAEWFATKNAITTNKRLTKSVRLFKYIRDYHHGFEAKSILLTTLLGKQVYDTDTSEMYPDIPTTFKLLINRLDDFLQMNEYMPDVNNPVLEGENFNRHWDQEKYEEFKDKIHAYRTLVDDAYNEIDDASSAKKWQKVFGDEFGDIETKVIRVASIAVRDIGEEFLADYGITTSLAYTLNINARVTQNGYRPFMLRSWTDLLRKSKGLEFFIEDHNIPVPFEVKWKVKNTGEEAKSIDQLRGEILDDAGHSKRNESTRYVGEHYVECYAIVNGVCVAMDRLVVPIGSF